MNIENRPEILEMKKNIEEICSTLPCDFSNREETEIDCLKNIANPLFERFVSTIGTEEVTSEYRKWTGKYSKEIREISEMVGIYVSFVSNRFSCHFLPLDLYDTHEIFHDKNITPSIKDKFISKYNLFSFWLPHVLDIDEIMDKYEGQVFGNVTIFKMNDEFHKKVQEYNNVNSTSIGDIFMGFVEAY